MSTVNIVDAVLAHDKEAFMAAFNNALADKVTDALEVKKVEIASSLLTPEATDEVETTTTELGGSGENESAAASE